VVHGDELESSKDPGDNSSSYWGWKIVQGALMKGNATNDHTLGSEKGYFLSADLRTAQPGSNAVFSTPLLGKRSLY
jgi:hypothetical protein